MKTKPPHISAYEKQAKTHGAGGAIAQTPEDLLNLVRSHATWSITSNATKGLHRTQDGQLILVDRTPADLSGYVQYANTRPVSYADACKWIRTSGNRWKPEMLLQFHGIMPPATRRRAGLVTVVFKDEAGLECARIDLGPEAFALIKQTSHNRGWTLEKFFMEAVDDFVHVELEKMRDTVPSHSESAKPETAKQSRKGGRQAVAA